MLHKVVPTDLLENVDDIAVVYMAICAFCRCRLCFWGMLSGFVAFFPRYRVGGPRAVKSSDRHFRVGLLHC